MTEIDTPTDGPPPEALDLLERFQDAMRRGDVDAARALAPGVEIRTEGWPYEDETGPLNPDAFGGDPGVHRVMAWEPLGTDRLAIRTGLAYL
jgi:hypothetical protein